MLNVAKWWWLPLGLVLACGGDSNDEGEGAEEAGADDSAECLPCECPGEVLGFSCPMVDGGACQCEPMDGGPGMDGADLDDDGEATAGCQIAFEVSGVLDASYEHAESRCFVGRGELGSDREDFEVFVGPVGVRIPGAEAGMTDNDMVEVSLREEVEGRNIFWRWHACVGAFDISGGPTVATAQVGGSVDCSAVMPDVEGGGDTSAELGDLAITPFDFRFRF